MALSKPQLGIQSPIQCQLCERDPKISWKCLECDLLMCDGCNSNIHPKIKTSGEHKIIPIKDIGNPPSPNIDAGSTPPSSMDSAKVDITVIEQYQTKLDRVFHLAISLDDTLWIGSGDLKKGLRLFTDHAGLQKVKCEGNKLKVISSFNIDFHGMAITLGNDLLIATAEPILKQIKNGTNKVVDTVYNLGRYTPISIYVTIKNKVIVGACYFKKDKNVVIVMDQDGNREKVYREDKKTGISFTMTWRIASTNNDHIFVIDRHAAKDEGRVVVLGHKDIVNTYSGLSVINTANLPFNPSDLTITPTDNVIVGDYYSRTVHILNSSGNLIKHITNKEKGIKEYPFSLGIAMSGQFCMLYLGTGTKDYKDKGKLYKLNLIGC